MECVNFLKQYIKNPRIVGAVLPSSQNLALKMVENVDFSNCQCILEYGPGTGVFTEKIINYKNEKTLLICVEYNYDFYNKLKRKYVNKNNVIVINDSAENAEEYLKKYNINKVDYIISGLPFASLSEEMSERILSSSRRILKPQGKFITFQYTKFKLKLFKKYFQNVKLNKEIFNVPPAYVLNLNNIDN